MELTELHGSRFELAIERFRNGDAFTYSGVGFLLAPDGAFEVRVASSWFSDNVTEQTAMSDFEMAKSFADSLTSASPTFSSLIENLTHRYILIDDYKVSGIELCRLV